MLPKAENNRFKYKVETVTTFLYSYKNQPTKRIYMKLFE